MSDTYFDGVVNTAQTGWDEAFLVGTEKELLEFAESIIESVESAKPDEFFGEQVKTSEGIYGELGSLSEVKFDWLVVTQDNEQTREIARKVQYL